MASPLFVKLIINALWHTRHFLIPLNCVDMKTKYFLLAVALAFTVVLAFGIGEVGLLTEIGESGFLPGLGEGSLAGLGESSILPGIGSNGLLEGLGESGFAPGLGEGALL